MAETLAPKLGESFEEPVLAGIRESPRRGRSEWGEAGVVTGEEAGGFPLENKPDFEST
jgi:hypothetical protein